MPEDYQPPIISPAMQNPSIIPLMLNPDDILDDFEHKLRGEKYDVETDSYKKVDPNQKPLLNEYGINEVLVNIRMFVNKVILTSDYDDRTIKMICHGFSDSFSKLIVSKYTEWELSVENMEMLDIWVSEIVFSALQSAREAGMRKSIFTAVEERRSMVSPQEKQRSIFNPFGW